jgi:transposase
MRKFVGPLAIYLYSAPEDFKKVFNGLALIIEQQLNVSVMSGDLFVFSKHTCKKLYVLYWDNTGFELWNKYLKK